MISKNIAQRIKLRDSTIFNYHKDLKPFTKSRLRYLRSQVKRLKKIKIPEQRTKEWYEARENKITASDIATAINESKYQKDYVLLKKKVTKDRKFISNAAMEWGVKYEEVAVMIYEKRNKTKVFEYGCLPHPVYDFIGASPDGITDDGIMLEIKCPSSRKITGVIPHYYWCQVQTQLEVCELDRCDFLECKLEEYKTREEYEEDNYEGNTKLNDLGYEKGVVMEYYNKKTKKLEFDYLKIGAIGDELDKFISESKNKHKKKEELIFASISYWGLIQISNIPIYRNQEWFNSKVPVLRNFWNDVILYRTKDMKELEKYIDSKKKIKKKNIKNEYKKTSMTDYYETIVKEVTEKKDSSDNIFIGIEKSIENEVSEESEQDEGTDKRVNKWSTTIMYMNKQ